MDSHSLASSRFTWRCFDRRHGRVIDAQLRRGEVPCCPFCGELLEARPFTRNRANLLLDATGFDFDCRGCRRFWCMVRHTPRSLRLMRMRRLVAAVRAVGGAVPSPRPADRERVTATV